MKILILIPYFGKFPNYFRETLQSMKNNLKIDRLFITDQAFEVNSSNIKIISMTFDDFKKMVKKKIGTDLYSPYKICDYRPAFGEMFSDFIVNYDYWGHCDLDLIFGNLDVVYEIAKENVYDKIFEFGHLCLYRNNPLVNSAYKNSNLTPKLNVDFRDILNSPFSLIFDENYNGCGINGIFNYLGLKVYSDPSLIADLDIKNKNFKVLGFPKLKKNKTYFIYKNQELVMISGDIRKNVLYVHFQKKNYYTSKAYGNDLLILPKGIFDYSEHALNKTFYKKGFYILSFRLIWYLKFRVKRYLRNEQCNKWCSKNNSNAFLKRKREI